MIGTPSGEQIVAPTTPPAGGGFTGRKNSQDRPTAGGMPRNLPGKRSVQGFPPTRRAERLG